MYKDVETFIKEGREASKKERESISTYVKSISIDTGLNFFELIENKSEENNDKWKIICSSS